VAAPCERIILTRLQEGPLLTGELAHVFLVAILDAALISWIALRWYRRSVRRLMRQPGTPAAASAPVGSAPDNPRSAPAASLNPLTVAVFQEQDVPVSRRSHHAGIGWRRLSVAYGIGAALHSAVITAFFLEFDTSRPIADWFGQWWLLVWPIVPTLAVVLVLNRYQVIRLSIGYVVLGALAIATVTLAEQMMRRSLSDAALINMFRFVAALAVFASVPLSLLLITGWRRIRAVTPLALSSTLVFGFALMLFRQVLSEAFNLESIRSVLLDVSALTSEYFMYYGVFMVLVLPVGWVAWRVLQFLAARFERKRFSDVQLVVDCWWLIVTAEEIVVRLSTAYGAGGIAAGVAAFTIYRIGVALTLAWLPDPHRDHPKTRLLLLRVFGYQARTETLFDRVAQQWRFHGPVQLIAGVDLAMRTVDPGDMLAFISGNLEARYVATVDDVGPRVSGLDMLRDPDGRFRVNEVYCRDDTWRAAVQALIATTDIVLMDLRGFSSVNSGCAFELEQLVSRLPPDRIVLVYDHTTDLRLLGNFLSEGWQRAAHDRAPTGGPISCVRVEQNSWSELELLMRRLVGLEQPRRVLAVADLASA
jgi:hypothetical protein